MPLVTIKTPEGAFSDEQHRQMIESVTEAMLAVEGEAYRDKTWVVLEEVPAGRWAIGGTVIGAASTTAG